MGGTESTHLNSRMTKSQVFDKLKSPGSLSYSFFRQERAISAFYHQTGQLKENEFISIHQPSHLTSLLLGCYEQLDHIPEIVETIIRLCNESDSEVVLQLSHSFDLYAELAYARNIMILTLQQFNPLLFTPFLETSQKGQGHTPSFDSILKTFKVSIDVQFKNYSKFPEIEKIANHFKNATPASAFPPPTPEFLPKQIGHTEEFSARAILAHGTSSNGQFLFVLCSDVLQIFPLFNMGSLIAPITRQLEYQFDINASLTADKSNIYIYNGENMYEYSIFDIIQKKKNLSTKQIQPGYLCYVSDGIVTVRIETDFSVTVMENNKVIRKLKLQIGNAPLNPQIPNLFPRADYAHIPIETNGAYLGFMIRINQQTVIYRVFSLITGKHVHDDVFYTTNYYYSSVTDTINRCHWVVSLFDTNKIGVRRYYFAGSIDPSFIGLSNIKKSKSKKIYKKFVNDMGQMILHYLGSQVIPKTYLASSIGKVLELIDLIHKYLEIDEQENAVIILTIILELNLKQYKPTDEVRDKVLDLVEKLPQNLGTFLFFNALQLTLHKQTKKAVTIMVDMLSKLKSETLTNYALTKIESCYNIAGISFTTSNMLSDLVPSDTRSESTIHHHLQSLLLIHQRVLITISSQYVKSETFDEIQFCSNKEILTPLDYLNDYAKVIILKFQIALSSCQSDAELDQSFILTLFSNFLNLLSSLSTHHVIAQFLTDIFSDLLEKINKFIDQKNVKLNDNSYLTSILRLFLFVYGKFAATLLKGTSLTDFEKHFIHIIRSNLDAQKEIIMSKDQEKVDKKIRRFISRSSHSDPVMNIIYKKFKPFMHKNLSEELKNLDKLALVTVCKHLGILEELYDIEFPFTSKIKSALDQMLKIRNASRVLQQNKALNEIPLKCQMLLRMNPDPESTPNEISDFVTSKETAETVIKMLMRQKIRTSLTGLGFSLVESVLSIKSSPIYSDIFTFTLAQIENFDGLASILKITGTTRQKQLDNLFMRILKIIELKQQSKLILFAFRFFRDCKGLIDNTQNKFLEGIISIFVKNSNNYALFALSLSLIESVTELPKSLCNPKQSPMGWLLQYIALTKVNATLEFFNGIRNEFWTCLPNLKRILCRVMFKVLNSTLIPQHVVKGELVNIIKTIGQIFTEFSDIRTANEYTWLLRRILTEESNAKSLLMDIILNVDHKDDLMVSGVFVILGNMIESIRPFCNMKTHANRTTTAEYIAVQTSDKTKFFCYERPFDLTRKPFNYQVTPNNLVYAVAVVTIDTSTFNNFDFILSFFDEIFDDLASIKSTLYLQVLAHFLKYSDFVERITPHIMEKLSESPLPFHTIHATITNIRNVQSIQQVPQHNGFNKISFSNTKHISYLSPQIFPNKSFNVTFTIPENAAPIYFGIVSDNVEPYFTRFSVVSFPYGVWYPYNNRIIKYDSKTKVTFSVDMENGVFGVGGKSLEFPRGETFRVIIAAPKNVSINITTDLQNFNAQACPSICPHGAIMAGNKQNLFDVPPQIKSKIKAHKLPSDVSQYMDIKSIIIEPLSTGGKVKNSFVQPPDFISIHTGFSTHASFPIIAEMIRGLFKTISLQWTTVCLMRIAAQKPQLIPNPMKLYTLLTVPLEPFSFSKFRHKHFPFDLDQVKEHRNSLYMSLEIDALNAIESLTSNDKIVTHICKCLLQMSESKNLHLLAYPHLNHTYMPPNSFPPVLKVQNTTIVSINSFTPYRRNVVKTSNKKSESLPFIYNNSKESSDFINLNPEILHEDISLFNVSTTDNSFAFDTAFEILLLLKNLSYVVRSPKQKYTLKSVFANLTIAQSPFVYRYLENFAEFLSQQLPPSPFDYTSSYIDKLYVMGGILKASGRFNNFASFIEQEAHILGSPLYSDICKHFPEFLPIDIEKPKENFCKVPIVSLDPGTIKDNFAQRIRTIGLFTREYKSLVGFPFWEILPYWLRITGAWRSSANNDADEIDPFAESISPDVMHISNPTGKNISIHLRATQQVRFTASSMLMMSTTPDFENAKFVTARDLSKSIEITGQHMFLALIEIEGSWSTVRIEFTSWKRYRPPPPEKIDISLIHDAFIADMTEFAVNWKAGNTEELLLSLPSYAFNDPTFTTTETIAKSCSLTHRFSTNVVVLRALLLHQFNYIKSKYQGAVPKSLWESMASSTSAEDAADQIVKDIQCGKNDDFPTFTIDRHAAKRLVVEKRGDFRKSIVTQLSVALRQFKPHQLICKKRPWKIKFEGELAVDAGGPTRELMTEVAISIFEPTTQLFIPVPNYRRGNGDNKDTFIPYDPIRRPEDYFTIGIYLGIVLRSGFSQDLPFAPLIWKYLAHEKLSADDIYAIDSVLEDQMKIIPQQCEQGTVTWTAEHWNGIVTVLPGHTANSIVRVEEASQYVQEVINYRIETILPMMKQMRKAFNQNIGFGKHPLLSGKLLSRMAQGSSVIATEHLKAITVVADYDGLNDPFVQRFWRVVEKFTSEQRMLLLKFITTLTRLPNPTINPDFRLQIDKMNVKNPDESLPTAATCFNRLHLPAYSNDDTCAEKILYAIMYCQSMENK
ncbi:hypothetical protein TRFO_20619 [Tritrichomonas foetus]|uniref:HECT domain-containing protein n=1 Tax=Tritrichomonas foetus TaxID=1144522 RepID=A0A1J4KGU0_9EUKA|nr:hypothetical protein TRFO_20619 [Tritrichomonas foetus]|eukprot:OHT10160.1 hypothetical protein TRFO_20619 [Tritrichomonas foetus]